MAKKKLQFTDEHIALIKALNIERINFNEILKSLSSLGKPVTYIPNPEFDDKGRVILGLSPHIETISLIEAIDKFNLDVDCVCGVNDYNPWGGTFIWEQMSYILGMHDLAYPDTLEDPDGPKFPPEVMDHFIELDNFIVTNLHYILSLITQFCTEGIKPGVTYWCYDRENIWYKDETNK